MKTKDLAAGRRRSKTIWSDSDAHESSQVIFASRSTVKADAVATNAEEVSPSGLVLSVTTAMKAVRDEFFRATRAAASFRKRTKQFSVEWPCASCSSQKASGSF